MRSWLQHTSKCVCTAVLYTVSMSSSSSLSLSLLSFSPSTPCTWLETQNATLMMWCALPHLSFWYIAKVAVHVCARDFFTLFHFLISFSLFLSSIAGGARRVHFPYYCLSWFWLFFFHFLFAAAAAAAALRSRTVFLFFFSNICGCVSSVQL